MARQRFLDPDGSPLRTGATLRQPEVARTMGRLMKHGARDLYEGALASGIDAALRAADGLLRRKDLEVYAPEWVDPVSVPYRGYQVFTTAPNSQGITALMMLNALTAQQAAGHHPGSAAHINALIRAKRAAFADRDRYVSDPRFVEAPVEQLLGLDHARAALAEVPPAATTSNTGDTVYLCTADPQGNACSLIQSLYYGFGSCFTAGDTGILLHNRGHYFSLAEDHPNRLEPGKRTLHTLMACMAFEDNRLRLVFGTMGADGQAQTNVQVLERLLAGRPPREAVGAPRVLHGRFAAEDDPELLSVELGGT